jgi:hypothetical protein
VSLNRNACIETYPHLSGHKRILGEALILRSVFDKKEFFLLDRVGTERYASIRFRCRNPFGRLEPLPISVDEGHQADWSGADFRSQIHQLVVVFFRLGIQQLQSV